MDKTTDRTTHPVDPKAVKVGDMMAFTYWVKVENTDRDGTALKVHDVIHDMASISINGKELVESSYSADYFAEEVKVSRTVVAEILVNSYNRPFTVAFVKKDGSDRILRGRFLRQEHLFGRSFVEDLDVKDQKKDDQPREVDHRTLQWIIFEGVKYIVK